MEQVYFSGKIAGNNKSNLFYSLNKQIGSNLKENNIR